MPQQQNNPLTYNPSTTQVWILACCCGNIRLMCVLLFRGTTCQGDAILGLCILSILLHCVTLGLIVQIKYMQRTTLEPAIKKIVKESYDEILEAQKKLNGLYKALRNGLSVWYRQNLYYQMFRNIKDINKKENHKAPIAPDTLKSTKRDKARAMTYAFPNAARPVIEHAMVFHDWIILFLVTISSGTLIVILILHCSTFSHRKLFESQSIECIWTLLPSCILLAIGLPSLHLLYLADEVGLLGVTIKTIGHQWYWQYNYSDVPVYDSYLNSGDYRLLRTDNRIFRPSDQHNQILVTAADVLHSWTVPRLGLKADAVPGRVNKLSYLCKRAGLFFGQCREICGRNHSFIPIALESFL